MSRDYHKPTLFTSGQFDAYQGGDDPALRRRLAHDSASALLSRVRASDDPEILDRVINYTTQNGIEELAELWSTAGAHTLPGTLWRIYLIRAMLEADPHDATDLFNRGTQVNVGIDPVIAGAPSPASPTEIIELSDTILTGVFAGDFEVALLRASSFSRLLSRGATALADEQEQYSPERASALTAKAARLNDYATDLAAAAAMWRTGALD